MLSRECHVNEIIVKQSKYIKKFTFLLVVLVVDDVEVAGDWVDVGLFGSFVIVRLVT